jgi:hypothetical protein
MTLNECFDIPSLNAYIGLPAYIEASISPPTVTTHCSMLRQYEKTKKLLPNTPYGMLITKACSGGRGKKTHITYARNHMTRVMDSPAAVDSDCTKKNVFQLFYG